MIPIIDLKKQQNRVRSEIDQGIKKVLSHGKYILGPEVQELEEKLCKFTGSRNCITVANGTDALQISLMGLGLRQGDEVITTAFGYISAAETIRLIGATPVFVDIEPESFLIDPAKVSAAITSRTKAIIPVSLFGQPADFSALDEISNEHGIPVIEDAAQSFGSKFKGRSSCDLSIIGCTSFFPSKPLGCYGDGGAIFTNDPKLAKVLREIARHGQIGRYQHYRLGINSRLDTIQAAVLLAKLTIFEAELEERRKIAANYSEAFSEVDGIIAPKIKKNRTSAWAQYTVRIRLRDSIQKSLQASGVQTAVHYPLPLSLQPAVACPSKVPHSERAAREVLSLPISGYLSNDDQGYIIKRVLDAIRT